MQVSSMWALFGTQAHPRYTKYGAPPHSYLIGIFLCKELAEQKSKEIAQKEYGRLEEYRILPIATDTVYNYDWSNGDE